MRSDATSKRMLAAPDAKIWAARGAWFWRAHDANAGPQSLQLDSRAGALLHELETVFCAGAWAAVVILAWTIVEAQTRAMARGGRIEAEGADLDWLRERRNRLVHVAAGEDIDEALDEAAQEAVAQGAVRIVFKTLFAAAWR